MRYSRAFAHMFIVASALGCRPAATGPTTTSSSTTATAGAAANCQEVASHLGAALVASLEDQARKGGGAMADGRAVAKHRNRFETEVKAACGEATWSADAGDCMLSATLEDLEPCYGKLDAPAAERVRGLVSEATQSMTSAGGK
ncbi:MAG: hypothetical protein SFX73_19395 [Kofleriaceae bacterium]|nr:hypothetical protein [Kofleriaceae bacterium]